MSSSTITYTTTMTTIKQNSFIKEYLSSGNATQSAMIAYGIKNKNVASATGSRLLRNVKVQAQIKASLVKEGIDEEQVIKALKMNLLEGAGVQAKASDSNRAGEILLKYLDKENENQNQYNQYNFMFANLTLSEAMRKREELNKWFQEILE